MFYGSGAGKLPTASAVVADIVDCCKHLKTRKYLYWTDGDGKNILPAEQSVSAMYVRANGTDVISKAENIFGSVSIIERADADDTAFVTSEITYGEFNEKIASLANDGVEVLSTIRIGDL